MIEMGAFQVVMLSRSAPEDFEDHLEGMGLMGGRGRWACTGPSWSTTPAGLPDLHGRASHGIVQTGLSVLSHLEHRGAPGCSPDTGDGAGVLVQVPEQVPTQDSYQLGGATAVKGSYVTGVASRRLTAGTRPACFEASCSVQGPCACLA